MSIALASGLSAGQVLALFILFLVVVVVLGSIKIVPQAQAYVIE